MPIEQGDKCEGMSGLLSRQPVALTQPSSFIPLHRPRDSLNIQRIFRLSCQTRKVLKVVKKKKRTLKELSLVVREPLRVVMEANEGRKKKKNTDACCFVLRG